MSNTRFMLNLTKLFLVLLLACIREIDESGPFAGIGIGMFVIPMLFIMSLMLGVLCGLRKPLENAVEIEQLDNPPTELQFPLNSDSIR